MIRQIENRPSWDEIWMNLALDLARRSRCCRDQVGCVVTTADNRVNSASYNGPPPGSEFDLGVPVVPDDKSRCDAWCPRAQTTDWHERKSDYSDCYTNHAEANALIRADYSEIVCGSLYVSSTPCVACAKNVAASPVVNVTFRVDPRRPRDPDAARWFLEKLGNKRVTIIKEPW